MNKFIKGLFAFLLICIPFHHNVWTLPILGEVIQPSEVAIGIYIIASSTALFLKKVKYQHSRFDVIPVVWLVINLLANFIFTDFTSPIFIESSKVVLLVLLYFSIRITSSLINYEFFVRWLSIAVSVSCIAAIFGWLLNVSGVPNSLCWQMIDYPYLGPVGRAKGFTSTPNMLGSLLMVVIVLRGHQCLINNKVSKVDLFLFCLFSLTFVLAISKTILCCFAVTSTLIWKVKKWPFSKLVCFVTVFIFLVYFFASHFVVSTQNGNERIEGNMELGYVSQSIYSSSFISVYPTAYWELKKGCWEVIKEKFPGGVGTRQFSKEVSSLKEKGIYFGNTSAYDPHCTILGILTDSGFLGCIFIAIFSILIVSLYRNYSKDLVVFPWLVLGIAILVESTVTDIMNFRHYWVLSGIFVSLIIIPLEEKGLDGNIKSVN